MASTFELGTATGGSLDPEHLAIKAYTWSLGLTSPECTIVAPSSITTQVTDLVEGDYEFKLVVTDQEDAVSAPVSLFVTVRLPENQIPVAVPASNVTSFVLGDETILELNGTGSSDPEGSPIKTYSWTLATGSPACIIDSPTAGTTTVSGIVAAGTYSFILIVTDQQDAASGASSISVIVTLPVNQPPIANAGEDQTIFVNTNTIVFIPGTVTLNGSGSSDPDGAIQSFAWQQTSGPTNRPATITDATAERPFVGNLFPGIYVFQLTVTDNRSASASDSVTITVETTLNELPVANAGEDQTITLNRNSNGLIPGSVSLDGSASSDPEGRLQTFNWQQIDGPTGRPSGINNATTDKPVAGNLFPGVYIFQLTVTDNSGSSSTDTVTITVKEPSNVAPIANAGLNRIIDTGSNANLDGSASSDPDGTIRNFEWKIIEPVQTVNESISVTGNATANLLRMQDNNRYRIRLTVQDDRGLTATDDVYVWTRKNSDLQHQCINGEIMTGLFNTLLQADPNIIGIFKEQFKSFDEVDKLSNALINNQVFFQPVPEQIKFFNDYRSLDSATGASQTLPKAMIDWLRELIDIITTDSGEFKETRNMALRFYRTIIELAIYISCIQTKDFNAALVKMNVVLNAKHIKIFTKEMLQGFFKDVDIAEYKLMGQLFADELSRLLRDDTTGAKTLYVDFITDGNIYFEELEQ